jgi:hypothetical protein
MATNIVNSLFGISPQDIAQQQSLANEKAAFNYANLSAPEQAQYGAFMGGRLAGNAVSNMLGVQDPEMQQASIAQRLASQFDTTTPQGMEQFAAALNQAGAPMFAAMAVDRRNKMLESQATIAAKMREKIPATGELVNQSLYADALRRAGGDPIKAAQIYDAEEQAKKKQVAAAGAPPSGQVPLTTLGQAVNLVDEFTSKPKAKLDQIKVVSSLGQGVKNNPTLLPQFQREAVKFAGDNQISAQEVNRVLGSSGFAADTIDGINKFLTGAPTDTKIDDVLKGFKVLEKTYADQYNTGRKKAETVLTEGKINEQTRNAVLPPAYNTAPTTVPDLNTFLTKARVANPGKSDAELTTFYNNKYRKQ